GFFTHEVSSIIPWKPIITTYKKTFNTLPMQH
ncbi:unnamed protein product, partial [Rotaria sordida]